MSIKELEEILQKDDEQSIEILPNGEIRVKGGSAGEDLNKLKPLTMRDNLGGEYAHSWRPGRDKSLCQKILVIFDILDS